MTFRLDQVGARETRLVVTGVVDTSTGLQYIGAVVDALGQADRVTIDIEGVLSYDGMGLVAFVWVYTMAQELNKHVVLTNPRPEIAAKLQRAGLLAMFTNHDNRDVLPSAHQLRPSAESW